MDTSLTDAFNLSLKYWPLLLFVSQFVQTQFMRSMLTKFISRAELAEQFVNYEKDHSQKFALRDNEIRDLKENLLALRSTSDEHSHSIVRITERIDHLPSQEDITKIHAALAATSSQLQKLVGSNQGLDHQLRLIHQHLLASKE